MEYKIPDNIKKLCAQDDLSNPDEQELVKKEFVKYLEAYLSLEDGKDKGRNSLSNITDIVKAEGGFPVKGTNYPFERDVAGRMMRTRNYTMKEAINDGRKEVYVIAADRDWTDRNKVWYSVLLIIIGTLVGALFSPLPDLMTTLFPQEQPLPKVYQLTIPLPMMGAIGDSSVNLEIVITDSSNTN